jgi:hypothetical protein
MSTFELAKINKLTLEKHHLTEETKIDNIIKITDDICGLHSTNLTTSYISLLARTVNFNKSDLERELYIKKTLGRIRCMRRTLFIQTIEMIPIVYAATFKIIENSFEKYMEFHKITSSEFQELSKSILEKVNGRELSTSEIRKELNSKANIPAVIQLMGNYGLLIRGKPIKDWKDRRNKYAAFKDYLPDIDLNKFSEKEAISLLVEKYVKAYGPVTEKDISWWTGLTKTKIRSALDNFESQFQNIKIKSIKGNFLIFESDLKSLNLITDFEKPTLALLPELDPYLMGYKERDRYIINDNYDNIFDRSGNITSTILLNGLIIGVWDKEEKPRPFIKLYLFQPLTNSLQKEIYSLAQKLGFFYYDKAVEIIECSSMTPLTKRNAGGFMSPLKNC